MTSLQKYLWPFEGLYHLDDYLHELDKTNRSSSFPKWEQWVENEKLIIQFLVAGYPKENFSVSSQQDRLIVEAKKAEKHIKSRFAGRAFKQVLQDPHGGWDFAAAIVTYQDGILRIEIPIRKEAQSQQIKIY